MVEASRNKTRMSVSSATTFTNGACSPTFDVSKVKKLAKSPTKTNTMGGVMIDFSASFENKPYPSIKEAIIIKMGYSLMNPKFKFLSKILILPEFD
jgi:hypothetical protein